MDFMATGNCKVQMLIKSERLSTVVILFKVTVSYMYLPKNMCICEIQGGFRISLTFIQMACVNVYI